MHHELHLSGDMVSTKKVKIYYFLREIFHIFVLGDSDTINNFEGHLIYKFPYF